MHDPITAAVIAVFSAPGVALWLAAAILVAGIAIIVLSEITEYRPLTLALVERWNILSSMISNRSTRDFAAQLDKLDFNFASSVHAPPALVQGWATYRHLLTQADDGIFETSIRAADAFDRLDEPARALEWWANILVAVGLVITFLGIVAALSEATAAMTAEGGNGVAMQGALVSLLAIAATKFWTSIAGVLASILLRIVARFRRKRIEVLETALFTSLDACVRFQPPEKLMLQQLQSLNRIEAALSQPSQRAS